VTAERQVVSIGQGRMVVWSWGAGEPVVCLHPLALSGAMWQPLATALGASFRVLAPDLRGHGRTSWDRGPFDVEDLARDVAEALDALSLGSVHLLGMSLGGGVAMTFAGRWPDRVRSLTLADTTAWYGEHAVAAWTARANQAVAVPREQQVTFQLDRWFSEAFRADRPDQVRRVVDIFVGTDSEAHAAACHALGDLDARRLLPAITARTLVLVGEEDYATPPAMAQELADTIPNASLLVLPALRHLSLVERPELASVIRAHLTAQEVRR
jgi:3-oxoadipate enol-lactonase